MGAADDDDRDPDILLVILQLVLQVAPDFGEEKVRAIEQQVREQYGGLRTRIPKRKKHPTPAQRRKALDEAGDAIRTAGRFSTAIAEEVARENHIDRATLYRYLKRRKD